MTQQKTPDAVALYESAAKQTRGFIAATKESQWKSSTPCTDWNVQALLDHPVGGAEWFQSVLSGTPQGKPAAGKTYLQRYDEAYPKVLQAAKDKANLEKTVDAGFAKMPGAQFLNVAFFDTLIHGWDLAKATGQNTRLDTKLVEACYAIYAPQAPNLRANKAIGPEVKVPANADTQTKLLAVLGRKA